MTKSQLAADTTRSPLRLVSLAFVSLVLLTLSSCASQTAFVSDQKNLNGSFLAEKGYNLFFLWGLGQDQRIDANYICGNREVVAVRTVNTFLNHLARGFTGGIVWPVSYEIYCQN